MSQISDKPGSLNIDERYGLIISRNLFIFLAVLYLLILALAEFISRFVSPVGGISVDLVLIIALSAVALFSLNKRKRALWLALGMAPLIRIISLALPVMLEISQYIWYVVVSIPILVTVIAMSRALKYSPENIGLSTGEPIIQFLVAAGGVIIAVCCYYFLRTTAWTQSLSLQSTLFPALVLFFFTGFVEELVFRGLLQKALDDIGPYWWMLSAVIYAVLQISLGSFWFCCFTLIESLYFAYMVKNTGSILGVSFAHGLINICLFLIFPYIFIF